jgi:predicted nuclease with RNAse H fold
VVRWVCNKRREGTQFKGIDRLLREFGIGVLTMVLRFFTRVGRRGTRVNEGLWNVFYHRPPSQRRGKHVLAWRVKENGDL